MSSVPNPFRVGFKGIKPVFYDEIFWRILLSILTHFPLPRRLPAGIEYMFIPSLAERLIPADKGDRRISSFHVIGVTFDRVYRDGGLADPVRNIQTTMVPPGGASVVDFQPLVPGNYTLLDHAIFRVDRGAMGFLSVEGPAAPDIYKKVK